MNYEYIDKTTFSNVLVIFLDALQSDSSLLAPKWRKQETSELAKPDCLLIYNKQVASLSHKFYLIKLQAAKPKFIKFSGRARARAAYITCFTYLCQLSTVVKE